MTARLCEVDGMCNLSQVIYDRAMKDCIRNLMETTGWNIEESMAALNIPEERKDHYRKEIIGIITS